jgi:predicted nucleic acid-binding protein
MTASEYVLVDTCGWISWLTQDKHHAFFGRYMSDPRYLLVPTIVQFELYKWVCREKDETLAAEVIGLTEQGTVAPLDTSLALLAAELAPKHKLAMADAVIYAASQLNRVLLVTNDKHFQKLDGVVFPQT